MLTKTNKYQLTLLIHLFCWSIVMAQNVPSISGPTELCEGECGTYTFNIDGVPAGPGDYTWDDGQGGTYTSMFSQQTLCFSFPGVFTVFANSALDSLSVSLDVFVNEGFLPDIVSNANCPDNTEISPCEKVCSNATVTYTVPFSQGLDLEWDVQGAESYEINGESCTVVWGNPGSGYISVFSFSTTNPGMALNCASSPAMNGEDNGGCWVEVSGGSPPYSYNWANGTTGQNTSNLPPGVYCVTVTDSFGDVATCCVEVEEADCPNGVPVEMVSNINSPSDCNACNGSIDLTVTGGVPPFTYLWSNGVTVQNPTDLCAGIYSVTIVDAIDCVLTANFSMSCSSSPSFCTSQTDLCIDIIEDPEAIITSDPPADISGVIEICEGQTVYFGNESTQAESYEWSSGNGLLSSSQDAAFTYNNGGTYEVRLVAKNECLCSDTTYVTVIVEDAAGPDIDCVGTVCEGETVSYTANAAGCSSYNWTVSPNGQVVDGGTTSDDFVTVYWDVGPEGTIELDVNNCGTAFCQMATIEKVPIISDAAEIKGPEKVCRGDVAVYSITHWGGTEYNWTVSNYGTIKSGQNSHEIVVKWDVDFIPPNQQWVAVDYENCYLDCAGSDDQNVDIVPEFYLSGPIEACEGSTSQYQSLNAITNNPIFSNWTATAPDGTIIWTSPGAIATANIDWPTTPGLYRLDAVPDVPSDYCFDLSTLFVKVVAGPPPPMGIDGLDLICPGEPYNYSVVSTQPNNGFQWEINDGGNMSTVEGPSINVVWGNQPPYELSVVEISTEGLPCVSAPTHFSANAIVLLEATGTNDHCAEETGQYSATYYEGVDYQWSIIPADAGTVLEGQHTEVVDILWHTAGNATVQVDMCALSAGFPVAVHGLPEPVVDHPVGLCAGEMATISTTMPFANYIWKNDNGGVVSSNAVPNLPPGNYEVEVVDDNGCEGNATFFIESYPLPEVTISSPDNTAFCNGFPEPTIYALNTEDGYSYQWYRDNVPVGTNAVSLTTGIYGTYHLVVTDGNGCTNTSNSLPLVPYCGPITTGGSGTCTGGTCTLPTTCPAGTVNFGINATPDCSSSQYINTTVNLISGSCSWDFGDPASGASNFSTDDNPQHSFSRAGFYVVLLQANTFAESDCWFARIDTVPIVANFDVVTACAGAPTQFLDLTTFLPAPYAEVTSYDWDFGDPGSGPNNSSTDAEPDHVYAVSGNYTVTLTATNQDGCTSSVTKTIEVYAPPVISFPQPALTCEGTPLEFSAVLSTDVVDMEWDFGDPASGEANTAVSENTFHEFVVPGNYLVTLTAWNVYGCETIYNNTVTIDPNPLNGGINYTTPICEGVQTTLAAPPGGISWEWSTGATSESIQTSEAGVYTVTIVDVMGCQYIPPAAALDIIPAPDGSIMATEYNEFGQPLSNFFDGYSACEGEDVFLQILAAGPYSYQWSSGQFGNQLSFDGEHLAQLSEGSHDFTVTITDNSSGCTSVIGPYTVDIHPLPSNIVITASPFPVCEPAETTLSVLNPDANYTYFWSNGVVGTTLTTSLADEYYVMAVSPNGCEGQSNTLDIYPAPDISLVPDGCHERCNPDTICLPPIPGVVSYQWHLDGNPISGPAGSVANYVAVESGMYQVLLTDNNGCTALSEGLTLNLLPLDTSSVSLDACTGEMVDYEGNMLAPGSVTDFVHTNQHGCDSTITVTVVERPLYNEVVNLSGCEGSVVSYNGIDYPVGMQVQLDMVSQYGCDSIVNLVIEELAVDTTALPLSACEGGVVEYAGFELAPGETQAITLTSSQDCDSVVIATVSVYPDFSFDTQVSDAICWNANDGHIVVENIVDGTAPFLFSLDDDTYQTADSLTDLNGGQYTVYVQDDNGCVKETTVDIGLVEPIAMLLEEVVLECGQDSVTIAPILTNNFADQVEWLWQDGSTGREFPVFNPGQYVLQLSNSCESLEEVIDVGLQPDGRQDFIYMPNAFSPNFDGNNDYFTGLHSNEVSVLQWELWLFDRWGNTLFHSTDIDQGWDGAFNGTALNPGVYVWWYKARILSCHREMEVFDSGDITVFK